MSNLELDLYLIRNFFKYIKHIHRYYQDINNRQFSGKLLISSIIFKFQK
jgi:hypothetical protein